VYDELYTVGDHRNKLLPLLEQELVNCALCGRLFKRITHAHLMAHSTFLVEHRSKKWNRVPSNTLDQMREPGIEQLPFQERNETLGETYGRLFGGTSRINAVVQKLLDLYHPSRTRWILMDPPLQPQWAHWMHVTAGDPAYTMSHISRNVLKMHLRAECTIGVFSKSKSATSFLVWDLDYKPVYEDRTWNPEREAKRAAMKLVLLLRQLGFSPHVVASGQKGYHVIVFFERDISVKMALQFFHFCLDHLEGPTMGNKGAKIECLPIENASKLPLGIHWSTSKFSGFVDPLTLVPVPDPYEYVLSIQPDVPATLYNIKRDKEQMKPRPRKHSIAEKWNGVATELAYKIGIREPGTRHHTLLQAAAYIRNSPHLCPVTVDEFYQLLFEWSEVQYQINRINIRTGYGTHLKDVEQVAWYVWNHPFTPGLREEILVRADIVHWIRKQTPALSTQQLLFAAWYQSELVNGSFYLGYERMKELTGLAKDSLDRTVKELRDKQRILSMVKNYSHSLNVLKSKVRQYRLKGKPKQTSMGPPLYVITAVTWDSSLWFQLLRTLFSEVELKRDYPFASHRIMKVPPLSIGSTA